MNELRELLKKRRGGTLRPAQLLRSAVQQEARASKESFSAERLIELLSSCPTLAELYQEKNFQKSTIADHHIDVLNQFERYFSGRDYRLSTACMRVMLAIHDIGKPLSRECSEDQHHCHLTVLKSLGWALPFSPRERDIVFSLIQGDAIGLFIQGHIPLKSAVDEIRRLSEQLELSVEDFYRMKFTYYQCDVSSYTSDGGKFSILDEEFEFDASGSIRFHQGRMKHCEKGEQRITALEEALFGITLDAGLASESISAAA